MRSDLLDFLLGYERTDEKFESSTVKATERRFSARMLGGMGSTFAKKLLKSPFSIFVKGLARALASAEVCSYGAILLSFGAFTVLFDLMGYYFRVFESFPFTSLAVGVVFALISVPMLFVKQSLTSFLQSHALTDVFFFDILCLRRLRDEDTVRKAFPVAASIIIGAVLAVIGFLTSLPILFIILGALLFTTLSLSSPEFSLMVTLLVLPVIPLFGHTGLVLSCLIGVCAVSFFTKVAIGKRLYHFEQYDAILALFILFVLLSGIFNKGISSFLGALVIALLSLSYVITSNIIVNRRLADNAINLIVFSSIPTAVYGIIKYTVSSVNEAWLDPAFSTPRADATFGNPNIYAVYLLVTIVFSAIFALDKTRRKLIGFYLTSLVLNLTALVLTWTRGAWLALIIAALAFVIIRSRRTPKLLLLPVLSIPLLLLILPGSVIERLASVLNFEDTSIVSRLSIWRSSLTMLGDNLFSGIGIGWEAFADEFSKYAEDSVSAPHSHNLYLEIGIEVGIFALILFIFLLVIRVRHRATYAKYVRNSSVDFLCTMSGTALFALLAFGMTDYVWYSLAMYVLFWTVFGIGSATLRISRTEFDEAKLERASDHTDYAADISITVSCDE